MVNAPKASSCCASMAWSPRSQRKHQLHSHRNTSRVSAHFMRGAAFAVNTFALSIPFESSNETFNIPKVHQNTTINACEHHAALFTTNPDSEVVLKLAASKPDCASTKVANTTARRMSLHLHRD